MPASLLESVVDGGEPGLALAGWVAAHEDAADPAATLVLHVRRAEDAASDRLIPAFDWLRAHGRAAVLRTRAVLPRDVVSALDTFGVAVELEVAHRDPDVQRALLGASAAPAASLLLFAQHLRARGVPVHVRLGPLVPGLHDADGPEGITSLGRHLVAADLLDVELGLARMDARRLRALQGAVTEACLMRVADAYGVTTAELIFEGERLRGAVSLPYDVARLAVAELADHLRTLGLEPREPGSFAAQHAEHLGRRPQPVGQAMLFAPGQSSSGAVAS
jgi:hypothetical protein